MKHDSHGKAAAFVIFPNDVCLHVTEAAREEERDPPTRVTLSPPRGGIGGPKGAAAALPVLGPPLSLLLVEAAGFH